jgi:hypothetical protein
MTIVTMGNRRKDNQNKKMKSNFEAKIPFTLLVFESMRLLTGNRLVFKVTAAVPTFFF